MAGKIQIAPASTCGVVTCEEVWRPSPGEHSHLCPKCSARFVLRQRVASEQCAEETALRKCAIVGWKGLRRHERLAIGEGD